MVHTARGACLAATARATRPRPTRARARAARSPPVAMRAGEGRGLAPHGPTAHDDNERPARVKDSHPDVRESALGEHAFSSGAVEGALRGDRKRGIETVLRGRHAGDGRVGTTRQR